MSEAHVTPLYCPYCGEEDLYPNEAAHGAWECHACARVFSVKFTGLLPSRPATTTSDNGTVEGVSR